MESTPKMLKKTFTANLRPAYYDSFQCIADKCQIDCCTGWNIQFNRKDYLKVRQQKGSDALNIAIKEALYRNKSADSNMYAAFRLKKSGCPLLTENKLCRLQAECGYDVLPDVCKTFPRRKSYTFAGYYEYSLSLACEAVLEQLWNLPEGIDFVSDPLPKKDCITRAFPIENLALASYFQEIRSLCIGLLQDRRFPLRERILLMGIFLQKLTAPDADIPTWLQQTEQMLQHPELATIVKPLFTSITKEQQGLVQMQHVKTLIELHSKMNAPKLYAFVKIILEQLITSTQFINKREAEIKLRIDKFRTSKEQFSKTFASHEYFFENLAVTLYFYQAIPECRSSEELWKSYVNFCHIYSLFHFMAICSCLKPAEDEAAAKANLFCGIVCAARSMLHNINRQTISTEEFFKYENESLGYMAMLLSL